MLFRSTLLRDPSKKQKRRVLSQPVQACFDSILRGFDAQNGEKGVGPMELLSPPTSHCPILLFPGSELRKEDTAALRRTQKHGLSTEEETPPAEEIIYCNACDAVVQGDAMKCCDCFDYDLCLDCYPTQSKVHFAGTHRFVMETT